MTSDMERLRRFARGIGLFWKIITYAALAVLTLGALWGRPSLLREPRGWLLIGLACAYAAWYEVGARLVIRPDSERHRRERMALQPTGWRPIAFWAGLIVLNLALIQYTPYFGYLLWVAYGVGMTALAMPGALLLVVPTGVLMFAVLGWLPHDASPTSLLSFAGGTLGFVVYTAVLYLPFTLLRGRFERERVYLELERSHRELEEAHLRLEASAARDRELAVWRERARLARDMHDTLGHSLALIAVKLEAAQRLRPVNPERADHEVSATQTIAREALAQLRLAIADLRAPITPEAPLSEALCRLARDTGARAGWQVQYRISPDVGPLDERTYETLLRVGSEALANVERHAQARTVVLGLAREGGDVVLRIEDDGVGILRTNPPRQPAAVPVTAGAQADMPASGNGPATEAGATDITSPSGHYGITGMRERVTTLGGTFRIQPGADARGTRVEVRVPANGGPDSLSRVGGTV
jgi:signal transduction histidine kinase